MTDISRRIAATRSLALMALVVGTGLSFWAWHLDPKLFMKSYLTGYLYWVGLPLGGLGFLFLYDLTGGLWGRLARPYFVSAARTLPLMALLFIPIALCVKELYPWAAPHAAETDHLLAKKQLYLNVPFFWARSAGYFLIWLVSGWATGVVSWGARRAKGVSGLGLVLFVITVSFAAIDWAQTLDPHWFSSIYGTIFLVSAALSSLSITVWFIARWNPPPAVQSRGPLGIHDLGNLMLACTMLWAYMSYSQYMLIFAANIADEVGYFIPRREPPWRAVTLVMILAQFPIPFFALLFRAVKRNPATLALVALWLLAARAIHTYWLVKPSFHEPGLALHPLADLGAFLALGGLWLLALTWTARTQNFTADPAPLDHP